MKKLLLCVSLAVAAWHFYGHNRHANSGAILTHHDQVIMYGLTTCGYCKAKAKELHELGIAYVEYDIDVDHDRELELNEKLKQAGFPPRGYGTPIFDVHGTMLPNNPDIAAIQKILQDDSVAASHG